MRFFAITRTTEDAIELHPYFSGPNYSDDVLVQLSHHLHIVYNRIYLLFRNEILNLNFLLVHF